MALTSRIAKRPKWALDFLSKSKHDNDTASPPGYSVSLSYDKIERDDDADYKLIIKKSWNIALGPLKQLPMNLMLMYMSGNSISIFPIMIVGMMFFRPVKAFLDIQTTFNAMEGDQRTAQKFLYFVSNLLCLGLALFKCHTMRLLPIWPSDWLDFKEPQQKMEYSGGGLLL